jgi:hypothetical protein
MAGKDSTYTTLNIRFARVTREAARNYLSAQKQILGRHLSFTQLVNDCLIERLERDGFLPKIVLADPEPPLLADSDPPPIDPSLSQPTEEIVPSPEESLPSEIRPWEVETDT